MAVSHLDLFPVEVNTAPLEVLLRVPGIGPRGARLILRATTHNLFAGRGASKAGDRVQASALFHHLQWEVSRKRGGVLPRGFAGAAGKPIEGGRHGARSAKVLPGQLSLFGSEVGAPP